MSTASVWVLGEGSVSEVTPAERHARSAGCSCADRRSHRPPGAQEALVAGSACCHPASRHVVMSPIVNHRRWRPGKLEQSGRLGCEPEISTLLLVLAAVGSVLVPSLPTAPRVHGLKP